MKAFKWFVFIFIITVCLSISLILFFVFPRQPAITTPDVLHIHAFLPGTQQLPRLFADNFNWDWDTVTFHRHPQDITYPENAELLSLNLLSGYNVENCSYLVFRKNDAIAKIVSYPLSCVFYDESNALIQARTYRSDSLFYTTEQVDHELTIIRIQQNPG